MNSLISFILTLIAVLVISSSHAEIRDLKQQIIKLDMSCVDKALEGP